MSTATSTAAANDPNNKNNNNNNNIIQQKSKLAGSSNSNTLQVNVASAASTQEGPAPLLSPTISSTRTSGMSKYTRMTIAEFKLNDNAPRKQRHYLQALKQQEQKLIQDHIIPSEAERNRKDLKKDLPKMRTKDLDLPFKRERTSKLGKMFGSGKSTKMKKSPDVALHLIRLAIIDEREEIAEQYLTQLPQSLLKKKRPYEANHIFLLAMVKQMEKLVLIILDRGFPADVNSPMLTMKSTSKNSRNIPFKINASLFPSYFILAIAMGYETVVRFMIKLGANLNQSWYGLTPLHVALFCLNGQPNLSIINTLLEFGADPWVGIHFEQMEMLLKLKEASCNIDISGKTSVSLWKNAPQRPLTPNPVVKSKSIDKLSAENKPNSLDDPAMYLPILGVLQRPIAQYSASNGKDKGAVVDQTSTLAQDKKILTGGDKKPVDDQSSKNNLDQLLSEWKKDKFILPVDMAAAMCNKTVVLSILQKMLATKPKKPVSTSNAPGVSASLTPQTTRTVSNASNSSSLSATYQTAFAEKYGRDNLSLLIQQDSELSIYLLKSGLVDTLQRDPRGANPLHLAIRTGNFELVQVLLHFDGPEGLLLNSQGENGWTALHEAISIPNLEIFRFLMKKAPRTDIKNDFGDTAKDLGARLGIDMTDLDQVWFAIPKLSSNMSFDNSSSTIMPGASSTEILTQLDSRLLRIINSGLFEDKKKSNLLDLSSSPLLKRSTTGEKDKSNSSSNNVPNSSSPLKDENTVGSPEQSKKSMKLPFSKMFGKGSSTKKRTTEAAKYASDSNSESESSKRNTEDESVIRAPETTVTPSSPNVS